MPNQLDISNMVFLDTETTGLGASAQAVEIAVVDHTGAVLLDTLVRPTVLVESGAAAVHGITAEQLEQAPALPEVWPDLLAALEGRTVVIYNATFDHRILTQSARAHELPTEPLQRLDVWCAMRAYAEFWGDYNVARHSYVWQSLNAAIDQQGLVLPPGMRLHSALADAEMTRLLVERMLSGEGRRKG